LTAKLQISTKNRQKDNTGINKYANRKPMNLFKILHKRSFTDSGKIENKEL